MPEPWSQPAPCVATFSEGVQYTKPETAALTKQKMDHEKWRHEHLVQKINLRSKVAEEVCSRNVQQAKDEHLKMLAYARVYQIHSFDKYDPFKEESTEGRPKRKRRKKKTKQRPDTFLTLPHVQKEREEPETLVNSFISPQHNTLTMSALNRSFPQIVKVDSDEKETDNKSMNNSHYNAMVLWKSAAKKLFEKSEKDQHPREHELTRKAIAIQERPQRRNFFPGECKTYAALKRFMEQEAENVMQEMLAPKHTKEDSIRKMVEKAQLPDLIKRDKTFSAIVRDFKQYKEQKEERKHRKLIEFLSRIHNNTQ